MPGRPAPPHELLDTFLEIAGNLGFLVGNNDRRRERARRERRAWGPEQGGYSVSVAAMNVSPGPDDSLRIEVALRNTSQETRELLTGSWLDFFPLKITQPDGSEAQLNVFGTHQMEAARTANRRSVSLSPGSIVEADLPVGSLYDLKQHGGYAVRCGSKAASAISNELRIRI